MHIFYVAKVGHQYLGRSPLCWQDQLQDEPVLFKHRAAAERRKRRFNDCLQRGQSQHPINTPAIVLPVTVMGIMPAMNAREYDY